MLTHFKSCLRSTGVVVLLMAPVTLSAQLPTGQSPTSQPPSAQTPNGANTMPNHQMDGEHMDNGTSKMMRSADTAFAMKAAQGGMTEVKLGQLAADKANNPDVKAFGQQMVDDHGKANEQLKSVAKDEGMTLPTDVNSKQQAMYDKLSQLSGADFDKAYVHDMLMDHQQDVKEFTRESKTGKDAKIKDFASQTLPVVQSHLDKLKGIQSKMTSGASME